MIGRTITHEVLIAWLSRLVPAALAGALVAAIILPVYTDEIGWRWQERAALDGVDKLYSELCGPNTLARPVFFMWPARWFSATVNTAFADPFWIRVSGIVCALVLVGLIAAIVMRLSADPERRRALMTIALGLMALGTLPFALVISRPEQPLTLAVTASLLIALTGAQASACGGVHRAWIRALAIAALAAVALSYHLKGVFAAPLLIGCALCSSRARATLAPRIAASVAIAGMTALALGYWVRRMQCPDSPGIAERFAFHSVGAGLLDIRSPDELLAALGQIVMNLAGLPRYVRRIVPEPQPLSWWLPAGEVAPAIAFAVLAVLMLVWSAAFVRALVSLTRCTRNAGRRREAPATLWLALLLLFTVAGWSALQSVTSFYDAPFVLVLAMLAVVIAAAGAERWHRSAATGIGLAALVSLGTVGALFMPALANSASRAGYLPAQPVSVAVFGYPGLRPQIAAAARLCGIPPPEQARAMLLDDVTYFAYMRSTLPQHQLGVIGEWNGGLRDPLGYLRSRGSSGAVLGCHLLPPDLRARAKAHGPFCCLAAP